MNNFPKEYTIEKLEWDSKFFGYPVGRISFNTPFEPDEKSLHDTLQSSGFRLVYLFANPFSEITNRAIVKAGAYPVDHKITFVKPTNYHSYFYNSIEEYCLTELTNEVKELALGSGIFSRFRTDSRFKNHEFERLYNEWILKSIKKEIAQKVFIATHDSKITGLITLGNQNGYGRIGLLSVDQSYLGKKIGSDLLKKADNEAYSMGYPTLKVTTQFQNKAAYNLYLSFDFLIGEEINVYHFWNNDYRIATSD